MPNPCQGCASEEECLTCLRSATAERYDHIAADLAQLKELLALAKDKGLVNHAQGVPIDASLDRLTKDAQRSSTLFYGALDADRGGNTEGGAA